MLRTAMVNTGPGLKAVLDAVFELFAGCEGWALEEVAGREDWGLGGSGGRAFPSFPPLPVSLGASRHGSHEGRSAMR